MSLLIRQLVKSYSGKQKVKAMHYWFDAEIPLVTSGFSAQSASSPESIATQLRHHVIPHTLFIVRNHYRDVIMSTIASQITSLALVYSTVHSGADQRKYQSSVSLAFVWGIHRDRWIPRTKGRLRGKCFHFMTSSCGRRIYNDITKHIIVNCNRKHDSNLRNMNLFAILPHCARHFNKQITANKTLGRDIMFVIMLPLSCYGNLLQCLTHWGPDKMVATFQEETFSNGFPWIKVFWFWLKFHCNLFVVVNLIIFQQWLI